MPQSVPGIFILPDTLISNDVEGTGATLLFFRPKIIVSKLSLAFHSCISGSNHDGQSVANQWSHTMLKLWFVSSKDTLSWSCINLYENSEFTKCRKLLTSRYWFYDCTIVQTRLNVWLNDTRTIVCTTAGRSMKRTRSQLIICDVFVEDRYCTCKHNWNKFLRFSH